MHGPQESNGCRGCSSSQRRATARPLRVAGSGSDTMTQSWSEIRVCEIEDPAEAAQSRARDRELLCRRHSFHRHQPTQAGPARPRATARARPHRLAGGKCIAPGLADFRGLAPSASSSFCGGTLDTGGLATHTMTSSCRAGGTRARSGWPPTPTMARFRAARFSLSPMSRHHSHASRAAHTPRPAATCL
jgi:hypothetical protein